jgi:saccharopine dehydrogenase-like NADP-dependent oxidoreductase
MTSILILGGTGAAGRLIAEHLLSRAQARLTLAARRIEQARALAGDLSRRFPDSSVNAAFADTAERESLRAAFEGHDLVVVASPTTADAEAVVRACLDARADYLDIQLGAAKLALLRSHAAEIERAGLCFITEAGFHPGLPSALVRLAAAHLDSTERAVVGGYLNMGQGLPYTDAVTELVELFKNYDSRVYSNGVWTQPGFFTTRQIDFGGDIGIKHAYPMFFEELYALPEMIPSIQELGFYISESHWINDWIVTPAALVGLKLFPNAIGPIGRLLWWGLSSFGTPPHRVELMVEARGVKDGSPAAVRASVAHPDAYHLTAIPVAAALLQVLDGSVRRPGLSMMGHLVEPARLMKDMARMGVRCRWPR